ncbi:hypothetical protein D3C74_380390 [compost metagenome]
MVIINIYIAARLYRKVKLAVLCEQIQHMVQKRHIRLQLGNAAAIYAERQGNICFIGFAAKTGFAFSQPVVVILHLLLPHPSLRSPV